MSNSARFDGDMRITLPATLQAMEEFFIEFRRRSRLLMDRANCFAAELLVREALTNAVVHGCHNDPSRKILCCLRLRCRHLLIAVADDGDGFDWRAAWNHSAALMDCSGRGVEILRKYGSRVRYNHRGNVVMILKRFDEENTK